MPDQKSEAFDEPMTTGQRQWIEKLLKFKNVPISNERAIINWLEGKEQRPTIGKAGQTITYLERLTNRGKATKAEEAHISQRALDALIQGYIARIRSNQSVTGREPKPVFEASEAELTRLHKSVTGREPKPGRILSPEESRHEELYPGISFSEVELAEKDNITWRKKDIASLGTNCSCMRNLTRDMLLFAVEDRIGKANEALTKLSSNIEKYSSADPYWMVGWKERSEEALVEVETYQALWEELRNIKICE